MIGTIPKSTLDYLAGFDLAAIALTRDGRLISTRDPAGCEAAWWGEACHAGRLMRAAKDGDVTRAAAALGIVITEHAEVLARVRSALAKIDERMKEAQRAGALAAFNSEYRRRRIEAVRAGRRFMTYQQAQGRLRRALGKVAASGITAGIIARVFEAQ